MNDDVMDKYKDAMMVVKAALDSAGVVTLADALREYNKNDNKPFRIALTTALQAVNDGRVAAGRRLASNRLLLALGLPLRAMPAEPCAHCGVVHVRKTCPKRRSETPSAKRKRSARIEAMRAAYRISRAFDS